MSRPYREHVCVLLGSPRVGGWRAADLPRIAMTCSSSYSRCDAAFPSTILQNGQSSTSSQSGWSLRLSNCEIWKLVIFAKVEEKGSQHALVRRKTRASGNRVNSAPRVGHVNNPRLGDPSCHRVISTLVDHPLALDSTPDNLKLRRVWNTRTKRPSSTRMMPRSTHEQKATSSSVLGACFS